MDLGAFSISLAVKDLASSRRFYRDLGFEVVPPEGDDGVWESYDRNWVILRHRSRSEGTETRIGLFEGMFDTNTLTFNPPDVRAIQRRLKESGAELVLEADEGTGPGAAMLLDPDGNPVLLDQH